MGHAVRALAPIGAEMLQARDDFALSHPEVGVTRFLIPQPYFEASTYFPSPGWYRHLEGLRIKEKFSVLVADERPDIILIGQEKFAWYVPDLAKAQSVPCVVTIRGGLAFALLDGTYPADLAGQILGELRKIDRIVTQTDYLAEGARALGLDAITIIPNGIDIALFCPKTRDPALLRQLAIRDDEIVVMHVSNLKVLKRPMDLVDSAERALQRNPRLVYVIVGDGPLRDAMEKACLRKRISGRFRFVGWVEYGRVPDYLNLADLVVMPSEAESQARVYLETQACERLLLASDIPAAREVVEDRESGLLFRKGDIDDLTAKTLQAAADAALRADIGRKAREHVQAHSLDVAIAAHLVLLEHLVAGRAGATMPVADSRTL
jgi:glycosyltransferase involved in cell wall biosynthesis